MTARLIVADCVKAMAQMEPESVHAIVCDPPYSIGFMGQAWDTHRGPRKFQDWCQEWGAEAREVLKPGGHLLAFGGTRTFHRLASGLEDAGFEVRDCIAWMYGNGFPKSLDVARALDAHAGVDTKADERWTPTPHPITGPMRTTKATSEKVSQATPGERVLYAPETAAAQAWQGWGTALKPAFEPIVVARKPLTGTVAANVTDHGTGGINIDGCRVGPPEISRWPANVVLGHHPACELVGAREVRGTGHSPKARKPSQFGALGHSGLEERHFDWEQVEHWECTPGCPVADLDRQAPAAGGGGFPGEKGGIGQGAIYGSAGSGANLRDTGRLDADGGASRFFYTAKASQAERNAGLEEAAEDGVNAHQTVKPIDLMRWLVRLVTPAGGVVLDPFAGSGTTLIAATLEGFDAIGIESEDAYAAIARARLAFWEEHRDDGLRIVAERARSERIREERASVGQLSLL